MMRRALSDGEWELIEPFLPIGRYGPFPQHLREQFEGVIWRFRSGSQWREMPEEFGAWQTVYDRFSQWRDVGVFVALMEGMIAEAARRGQADMSLVSVDSTVARAHHDVAGMVVEPEVLAPMEEAAAQEKGATETGQIAPVTAGSPAVEAERAARRRPCRRRRARLKAAALGRPRTRPNAVAADKAYSSRSNRGYLRRRGIRAVMPEKADQAANRKKRGSAGGRPVSHDAEQYKERNTVERYINKIRAWRGLTTRYDKTPASYMAGLQLRGSIIWMRSLSPGPR
jgi:transposase